MPNTPAEIHRLVSEYMDQWRRADIASLMSMYSDKIRYHDMSTGEVIEYGDLERFLTDTFATELDSTLEFVGLVHQEGNTAFINWTQQRNASDQNKTVHVSGVELLVFEQDKIVSIHEFYDYREMGPEPAPKAEVISQADQMNRLGFDADEAEKMAAEIRGYFEKDKPYLQSDLNLLWVSERLGYTRNQISYIFNHVLGHSFYDFVNKHRVDHVIENIARDEKNVSIIELAIDAGFNSISGFYKAFKKQTGLTPTAYRKAMIGGNVGISPRTRTDDG